MTGIDKDEKARYQNLFKRHTSQHHDTPLRAAKGSGSTALTRKELDIPALGGLIGKQITFVPTCIGACMKRKPSPFFKQPVQKLKAVLVGERDLVRLWW